METTKKALSLTERVLYYQKTGLGYEELVRDLALTIYYYPLKKRWGDEDDAGEFYLFVYPRLINMLQNYREGQVPFEHYLHSNLYWCLHNYFKQKQQTESAWEVKPYMNYYIQPDSGEPGNACDTYVCDAENDEAAYKSFLAAAAAFPHNPAGMYPLLKKIFRLNKQGIARNATGRYRLLVLTLRYGTCLKEEELTYLAWMAGCDFFELKAHLDNLKTSLQRKAQKVAALCDKRNRTFFRCCQLEEQAAKNPCQEKQSKLTVKIAICRKKLDAYSCQLAHLTLYPSYRKIARELGLPRGTVDTAFRSIKKSLANIYPQPKKGYAILHEDSISIEQSA